MQRAVQEQKKKTSSKSATNDGLRGASLGLFSLLEDEFILDFLEDWLGEKELLSLSRVSRFFYFFANLEDLWKNICTRKWVKNKTGNFTFKHSWKYTTLFPRKNIPKGAIVPRVSSEGFHCPRITNKWNRVRIPIKNFEIPYCDVDRRDISELSVEEFKREYEAKSKPVIITGAMKNWKAMEKWSGIAFLKNYGDKLIKTNGTAHGHCFKLTYRDFKAYMDDNQDEKPLLLFDNKFTERLPELLEDYEVPPYFKEDMFDYMDVEDRPDWRWFLAGAARSGSPLHQDPHRTAAWNAVLCGRKRWAFYPPEVIPPGVDKDLIDTEYYASPDVMKWYVDHYPKIPSNKRPIECVVGPGEIMYVPSGYWHTVLNLDTPTIAITQNYCSQENFNYVYDDMIRKESKSLKKEFEASIQKKDPKLAQKLFSQFTEFQKKCAECSTGFMSESESEGSTSESD